VTLNESDDSEFRIDHVTVV